MDIHQFNIFFSWQSDIKDNKNIIRKGIKDACQKLKQSNGYDINIDEATRNIPGAPKIEDSIKDKINSCDIFIADITPITQYNGKQYPNSNVIFELGFAMRCMEVSRIIIIAKKGSYDANELPFDINHQRFGVFDDRGCNLDYEIKESVNYILDNGKFQYIHFFNDENLSNNISIGKYLPDVFLEDRKFKEYLRCFVAPYTFYTKLYDETTKLNFDYYNQVCSLNEKKTFDFSVSSFSNNLQGVNFADASKKTDVIQKYLRDKVLELEKQGTNLSHYTKYKIENVIKGFEYCTKRICLIKGKAGQGKTNIVCDFVENILLKRNIPFVFLNCLGIDAYNIENSIARALYPLDKFSFGDLLRYIQRFCIQQNKPFIIIIDGLNEHENYSLLKTNFKHFIDAILDYDFIKLIVTCRTEYFHANYKDLFATCQNNVVEYESYSQLNDNDFGALIDNYCDYFKFSADFTDEIKREFSNNLLLLRIFCDSHQNQNVGKVVHLRKDSLFSSYLSQMCENVASMIPNTSKQDVYFIIKTLVKLMLEKNIFSNVPVDAIWEKLSDRQRVIFNQFVDSNILIKKELSQKVFNKEVVGFTFDEFRDYMISHYLIDEVFDINTPSIFIKFVTMFTSQEHILREGLICFLFCYSKENNDSFMVLKNMNWFNEAFIKYIWEIKEENIDDDDVELLKRLVIEKPILSQKLIYEGRLNTNMYKKISVKILIDILIGFTDTELEQFLDIVWPINDIEIYYPNRINNPRDSFINVVEDKILRNSDSSIIEFKQNILKLLVFFTPFSHRASLVFKDYYHSSQVDISDFINQTKTLTSSNKLKKWIEKL